MATYAERIEAIRNRGNTTGGGGTVPSASQNTGGLTADYAARIQAIRVRNNEGTRPNIPDYSEGAKANFTPAAEKAKEDEPTFWDKLMSNLGFVGEKGVVGAVEGTEGTVNFAGYTGQMAQRGQDSINAGYTKALGDLFGIDKLQRIGAQEQAEAKANATKEVETVADFGDRYAAKVEEKYADAPITKVGKVAGDVAQGLGGMLPAVAANLIVPGSGLAVMTTGAIGNATQEAKRSGADDATAMAYGVAVGAVEAATEKLLGGMGGLFGKGALDDVAKSFINNRVKNGVVRGGLNTIVSAFGEGVEEFVAEFGQSLADRLTIKTEDRSWGEVSKDALYSALVGGIVGSIANIGDSIRSGREITPKEAAKEAAEQTAAEVENSLSGGVSVQPTTYTSETENANPGYPGQEIGETTAINDDPDNHSAAEQAIIEKYKDASDLSLRGFIEKVRGIVNNDYKNKIRHDINTTTDRALAAAREITGTDTSGYKQIIKGNAVQHIDNRHGNNGKADNSMANLDDFSRIGFVLDNFTDAKIVPASEMDADTAKLSKEWRNSDGTTAPLISFSMPVNGTYYVVEAVPSSNAKVLAVVSAYISPKTNRSPLNREFSLTDNSAQQLTSETVPEILRASKDNVAQPGQEVNSIYGKSVGAATPAQGKRVPTQNKAITQNINLSEQSRAANTPAPHERITEDMSLARAGAMLYTDSEGNIIDYEGTLDELMNKEGVWTGVESDAVQLLLKEAEKRGDAKTVKRIAERMAKEGTDLGQALQARKKWIGKALPSVRLAAMYQEVAKIAKDHKARNAKLGGKIEIPDFLAKAYLEADSEVKRDEIISDIQQYVAKQVRPTLGEAWTALRYTNMLGNFKTQVRNVVGNLTMAGLSRVSNEVAALAELIVNKANGGKTGRTKSAFVGKEFMQAAKADFTNVKKVILSIGKYNSENFKGDFAAGIEDNRRLLIPGLEQYRRVTNLAMETGDIIFSKGEYARSLAGYLKANGVSAEQLAANTVDAELMDKAREYAIKRAQEATFRDSNAFSDAIVSMKFSNPDTKTKKAINALGQGLAPFRRTPANVLVRAVEYSPIGIVNTVAKGFQAAKGKATASDIIDALAKGLTGSGLAVLGYLLADWGLLRGAGDEDEEGVDALMNRQDWSLEIPGVGSYTLDWASPATLVMFTGAVLSELTSDEGLTFADIGEAMTSLTEPFVQMSMLSGISDTLDSIKYSDNNLAQMAGTLAAGYLTQGLTNTLLGQLKRIGEENRMSTYTDPEGVLPEWLQRTVGKASTKMPVKGYQQTEYLNEFGETESSGSTAWRIFENLLSPGYWEASKEGETAYDFAQKIYDSLKIEAFPNEYPPDSVSYDGEKYALDQESKEQYQRTRGETAKEYMEILSGNAAFDAAGKAEQEDVISSALSYAQKQAKNEALENAGVKVKQSAKDKVIAQMSPSQYIDWLITNATTDVADGYSNTPTWQKFEMALTLPGNLAIDMIIAQGDTTGRKISAAVDEGISLSRAVKYYRAITERNAEGKSPSAEEKRQRLAALGFTDNELQMLEDIF